jgi:MFS transporter, DHA1 family, multidrug resistance protein
MDAGTSHAPRLAATGFVIALLTALSTLGSFATSVYLPSMPAIGVALRATPSAVQITLTTFLIFFASGQLLFGPLSDRFGRRRIMLAGFVIYVAASLGCALAASIGLLAAARAIQAFGACAGMVVSRAMVRDAFDGPAMTKVLSAIAVAAAAVPAAAPLIGGGLEALFGWRAAFFAAMLVGVVVAVLAMTHLPETNHRPLPRIDGWELVRAYVPVLASSHFLVLSGVNACAFGALFAFLSGSPHVMIEVIGISPAEFGIYPPMAIIGGVIGGLLTGRFAGRIAERRMVATGLVLLVIGALAMPGFFLLGIIRASTITLSMFVLSAGMSILLPVCTAAAIRPFAARAGTASALMGFTQMATGGLGSGIVAAVTPQLGVLAFPLTMAGMALAGALLFLALAHRIDFR